jgi:hypothetical protein
MTLPLTAPLTAPRDAHVEREGLWSHDQVTPQGGGAKSVLDASRLSFPLMLVLIIGSTTAGIVGTYYSLSAQLAVQNQELKALIEKNETLQRQIALDAVRIDETRVVIAEIKGFMTAVGMKEVKK